jgi:hypothetical protein
MLFMRRLSLGNMGWILLSIPLFCSLLEPSAPFGPGTVQLMPFLLCGLAVRNREGKITNAIIYDINVNEK